MVRHMGMQGERGVIFLIMLQFGKYVNKLRKVEMNNPLRQIYTKLASNKQLQTIYSYLPKKELSEKEWEKNGRPVPPPHVVKEKVICEYQKNSQYDIFVETGTYLGEMVKAQMDNFKEIISIELDAKLYIKAVKKFNKYGYIKILNGDSGKVLREIVPTLKENAIFWLDGHYSGGITARGDKDCPIFEELESILKSKLNHIVLIDDARLFNGEGDYPTIKKLNDFVLSYKKKSKIEVKDDITRIITGE